MKPFLGIVGVDITLASPSAFATNNYPINLNAHALYQFRFINQSRFFVRFSTVVASLIIICYNMSGCSVM